MDWQCIGGASVLADRAASSSDAEALGPSALAGTWRNPGVWAVVMAYLVVTVWVAHEANLWRDEMYSLYTTSHSPAAALRHAIEFELQPPLYFGALSVWRLLNHSAFFARLFSTLCGCAAIFTVAAICRRLVPQLNPVWGAAVLASHPFLVWAGTEVRVYALALLLSALLMLAFLDAYWERVGGVRARLIYAAVALSCLTTQYYLAVLFACFGATLLARRAHRAFAVFALDTCAVLLLSAPLLLTARAQLSSHREDFGYQLSVGWDAIHMVVTRFETYFFSFNKAIDESRWSSWTVRLARWAYRALVLGAAGLLIVRWRRRFDAERLRGIWPLIAMVGTYAACMIPLLRWAGPMSLGERHTAGLVTPALVLLVAAPVILGVAAAQAWASFVIVSNIVATLLTQVLPMAKNCDCRRVAQTIAALESTREPILVFPSEEAMPLAVYYQGKNRLLPLPRPASLEHWETERFIIKDTREIARVLEEAPPDHQGLWVHTGTYGNRWGRDKLEAFLAQHYEEDARRDFAHGVILRHFIPKEGASK